MIKICNKCGKPASNARKNRLVRGLCNSCYSSCHRAGTLEQYAQPAQGPTRKPVGTRTIQADGYVHLQAESGRTVLEHRQIMSEAIGRDLVAGETVHHINGIKHDNRLENLELWASPQPSGQRLDDLLEYVVRYHSERLRAMLEASAAQSEVVGPPDDLRPLESILGPLA